MITITKVHNNINTALISVPLESFSLVYDIWDCSVDGLYLSSSIVKSNHEIAAPRNRLV